MADTSSHPASSIDALLADWPAMFTAKDFARFLQIGESTLWRMESTGAVPRGERITERCCRWPRSAIAAWLASKGRWEDSQPCPPKERSVSSNGHAVDGGSELTPIPESQEAAA